MISPCLDVSGLCLDFGMFFQYIWIISELTHNTKQKNKQAGVQTDKLAADKDNM